jgi:2-polyprenyl-3-methyl-5-hydroxy-6-metoxy-1,4-benzoquinol methylase
MFNHNDEVLPYFELARCTSMLQSSPAMPPESSTVSSDQPVAEERQRIERFYTERFIPANAWSSLRPCPYLYLRQRQRRVRETLIECGIDTPEKLRELKVLDVGCGGGTNIAWLIELGVDPAHCTGIDLVPKRIEMARARIPNVRWIEGDVTETDAGGPYDFVMLLAVLTSVTYAPLKQKIVERCFSLLKPAGIFFFYDMMSKEEDPGSKDYKKLTYSEAEAYWAGRKARWFRKDLLKESLAKRLTTRHGVTVAEFVQAMGLFNIEGSFAYIRN